MITKYKTHCPLKMPYNVIVHINSSKWLSSRWHQAESMLTSHLWSPVASTWQRIGRHGSRFSQFRQEWNQMLKYPRLQYKLVNRLDSSPHPIPQSQGGTPSLRVSRYVPRFCPPFSASGRSFCPLKFDHVYHFIPILLGLISKAPYFQYVDDLFAPQIE